MLSVAAVSAGAASSGYYSADSYYAKDSEEARAASQWFGKGAEAAGLSGHVEPEKFNEVMQGFTPDYRRLGIERNGELVHRAGTDLTFSASKSVSIMALMGGDKRVIAAHDAAVKTALAHAEANFLQTRMRNPETGEMERIGGQKMIAGVFRHDTSRALDPQLHSHAVVANMTIGEDGKWRTVENKAIFENKMEIGAVYRNSLAAELTKIGYDVVREGKHGFVEIKGVPKDVAEMFSTRREQIREVLKNSVDTNASAAASRAALLTRNAKTRDVDRGALYALWRQEAAEKGFGQSEMEALKNAAKAREIVPEDRRIEARAAVEFAVRHISERASVYERGHVVKTALDRMERGTIEDVEREIGRRIETGNLVSAIDKTMQNPMSDARTILTERAVIASFEAARGRGVQVASNRQVDRALYGATLTDGQRAAVEVSLTTRERVVGVQGYAGTGKTYMLARVQSIAEKQGYEVVGLAPSHRAVQELSSAGIAANTLQSFLAKNEGVAAGRISDGALRAMQKDYAGKIIVVDEASMIGTAQMHDLLTIVNRVEAAKLVLVGDVKQLDAVEAGSPFRSLQRAGMQTASMADIMRQKNPEMLAAVHHIIRSEVGAFFEKVGDRVVETESPPVAAAERWLSLSPRDRANTMLITQRNEWRDEINAEVRSGLRTEGIVQGDDHRFERLEPQRLTVAQLGVAENYSPGAVVIFEREVKSLGAAKGESFVVMARPDNLGLVHDGAPVRDDKVALRSERTGREIEFEPGKSTYFAKAVTLYERTSINLAKGDAVRFDRTDLDEGVVNKATGEVVAITAETLTLRLGDEVRDLPRDHDLTRHIDYAWGSTVHGAQGATVENAIVALEASSLLTTQKSVYVSASRMKEDVTLFTDDRGRLEATVAAVTGERLDARDVIGDHVQVREEHAAAGRDPGDGPALDSGTASRFESAWASFPADDRDPTLTPEQEATWRAQMAGIDLGKGDSDRSHEMSFSATDAPRRTHDESHAKDLATGNAATDDGDRDDVRNTERVARDEERPEDPDPIRDEPGEDRFLREEMRHGTQTRGSDEHESDRDHSKAIERGDDEGAER